MNNGYRCSCTNPIADGYLNCEGKKDITCCPANKIVGGVCVVSGTCPPAGSLCGINGQPPCSCGCGDGLSICPVMGGGYICTVACAVNKSSCDSVNKVCYISYSGTYTSSSDCSAACVSNKCGCDSSGNKTCSDSGTGDYCTNASSCPACGTVPVAHCGCVGTAKVCRLNESGGVCNSIDDCQDCNGTTTTTAPPTPTACTYTVCECSGGDCQTVTKTGTTPCPASKTCVSCPAYNTCSASLVCNVPKPASTIFSPGAYLSSW